MDGYLYEKINNIEKMLVYLVNKVEKEEKVDKDKKKWWGW